MMKIIIVFLFLFIINNATATPRLSEKHAPPKLILFIDSVEIKSDIDFDVFIRIGFNKSMSIQKDIDFISKNIVVDVSVKSHTFYNAVINSNDIKLSSEDGCYSAKVSITTSTSFKDVKEILIKVDVAALHGVSAIKNIDDNYFCDRLTRKNEYKKKLLKIKRDELIAAKNSDAEEVDNLKKKTEMKYDSLFKVTAEKIKIINKNKNQAKKR